MKGFWRLKSGISIAITAMKDEHLNNTILFIERAVSNLHEANKCFSLSRHNIQDNLHKISFLELKLSEMEKERKERNLPMPLIPIITREWRDRDASRDNQGF